MQTVLTLGFALKISLRVSGWSETWTGKEPDQKKIKRNSNFSPGEDFSGFLGLRGEGTTTFLKQSGGQLRTTELLSKKSFNISDT